MLEKKILQRIENDFSAEEQEKVINLFKNMSSYGTPFLESALILAEGKLIRITDYIIPTLRNYGPYEIIAEVHEIRDKLYYKSFLENEVEPPIEIFYSL